MSLFRQKRDFGPPELIWNGMPQRSPGRPNHMPVTRETALKHSAVWACLNLRASLISTMPIDVFRRSGGLDKEIKKPDVLVTPWTYAEGQPVDVTEWLYGSQYDLDRGGNAFGRIAAWDGFGNPSLIQPLPLEEVTVSVKNRRIDHYKVGQEELKPFEVWHERQFTLSGVPVGLSPIAYAAASIGGYLSAQQFAQDWFGNGARPGSILKNTQKTFKKGETQVVKRQFMASVQNGEPFVTGSDWEYKMINGNAAETAFIESREFGITDAARFLGVPGDMIDAPAKGSSVTYANVTQRNLQLLIINLGPAIARRERALSRLVPSQQHVKLKTDAILRMDPETRQRVIKSRIDSRTLDVDEARELENLPPLTQAQKDKFKELFTKYTDALKEDEQLPEGGDPA
ncbi:phage portal protein [Sinomonas sp. JGH33]|uniref:Phage portal protein n=1 Tax=Sinomonas terricola TaxID=3110330 RepID=A0ABU5T4A9_9MICC|nr:phage portal protein [Sinomonas sp. JGH33]MEA5454480.1 phage portal protein [Sinomonas sp. JGH33]